MARNSMAAAVLLAVATACATACNGSDGSAAAGTPDPVDAGQPETDMESELGGSRPVSFFHVPAGYDASKPAPLVLLIHGYGGSGLLQDAIFRLKSIADEEGFFLVAPDGTLNSKNQRFWNATDTCCDFESAGVDDVAYLTGLVAEIEKRYSIDPKRRFVVGHSNGGAMAFRLACDAADRFAAIVSLAGPFYADLQRCKPSAAIAVQHMHGTVDTTVPYDGGPVAAVHPDSKASIPSAPDVAKFWAAHNRCAPTAIADADLDVDGNVAGAETKVSRYTSCAPGTQVILWTLTGSGHISGNYAQDFPRQVYGFLKSHPKQ